MFKKAHSPARSRSLASAEPGPARPQAARSPRRTEKYVEGASREEQLAQQEPAPLADFFNILVVLIQDRDGRQSPFQAPMTPRRPTGAHPPFDPVQDIQPDCVRYI